MATETSGKTAPAKKGKYRNTMTNRMKSKLEMAEKAVERYGGQVDKDELLRFSEATSITDMDRLAGVILYARYRLVDRMGKLEAFRRAFPERCYKRANSGAYDNPDKAIGEPLDPSTIMVKANRIESSQTYNTIIGLLAVGLHTYYMVERLQILEKAFEIAMDDDTSHRDRHNYMKLFLEETRKPDESKGIEVNFNLTQNNISIRDVEEKLDNIAGQLLSRGSDAAEIIDVLTVNKEENNTVKE